MLQICSSEPRKNKTFYWACWFNIKWLSRVYAGGELLLLLSDTSELLPSVNSYKESEHKAVHF